MFRAKWYYFKIRRSGLRNGWHAASRYFSRVFLDAVYFPRHGKDRTLYVIGLFGSGRMYVEELLRQNIGRRAKFIQRGIRVCSRPTSRVYAGHSTMKYLSRQQAPPAVTHRILQAKQSGNADLIFIYRHPLDSLLTNWVWWREYLLRDRWLEGISSVYKNTGELCLDLEKYFSEFESFAGGGSPFSADAAGLGFLSFPQFVEETELFIQSATLSLRMEDFAVDPTKELSKLFRAISLDFDPCELRVAPPATRMYRFLEVKERVPQFRSFIADLDPTTKAQIEKMGYSL